MKNINITSQHVLTSLTGMMYLLPARNNSVNYYIVEDTATLDTLLQRKGIDDDITGHQLVQENIVNDTRTFTTN